jgi:ubiquinone/menaquinone biosynthesis C-methylase UbiE
MDKQYNWMAKIYDVFIFFPPLWKKWIKKVIPHIKGNKILEVSFGNGYLMTRYGKKKEYEITGIDYNKKMLEITQKKIEKNKIKAELLQGNVEKMPFKNNTFDTIINTMAFTGYPDGDKALSEMKRILKPEGKLLIVDFDYPKNRNILGYLIIKLWEKFGDIIKDLNFLLKKNKFDFKDYLIGGFGSVHLFICTK